MSGTAQFPRCPWRSALVLLVGASFACQPDSTGPLLPPRAEQPPALLDLIGEPEAVMVGAGDIARCSSEWDEATALLLDGIPGTVYTTGDNAYSDGTAQNFAECYEPSWGRHKDRTRPSPGNHDYHTTDAAGYFDYFGALAGQDRTGYYSYDLGSWHVISLNSEIDMSAGSPQEQWLRADLAANPTTCTVAYWHEPRFSSGKNHGSSSGPIPLWEALYEHHVEIVLNGHDHLYERFAPQTPDGTVDPDHGIRQFTVGTGGSGLYQFDTPLPNSEARNNVAHGVLMLGLYAGSYQWEFVPVAGGNFTDSGIGVCHSAGPLPNSPPVAAPGGPYASEGTVTFDGTDSTDPDANLPLTYAWEFGDGIQGAGPTPAHTYAADGTYAVTLTVTDALGAMSEPGTTTAVIANVPPSVDAGPDLAVSPATEVVMDVSFTDPGLDDAPWSYSVVWGDGAEEQGELQSQDPFTLPHTYAAVGEYDALVTITDKDGGSGTDNVHVSVNSGGRFSVSVRVAAGSDDGEESASGKMSLSSSDLELVYDKSDQTVGMRFNGVTVPRGVTVTHASVQFQVDQTNSQATSLTIRGQAADDAPTFTSTQRDITSRATTSSSVSWAPVPWTTVGEAGPDQQTPDIASVVQEIVSRDGWSSGNSLVILVQGSGERTAEAYDGEPTGAPLLYVEYSSTSPPPNLDPVASFTYAAADLTVDFTDTSTDPDGTIASRVWDFGDGSTSSSTNPTHAYATEGTYTVTLTVTDDRGGTDTTSQDCTVTAPPAPNLPPTASFTFAAADLTVDFTDTSTDPDGTIASRVWDFGDGSTSSSTNPTHAYATEGTYTVTLTVTDDGEATDAATQAVAVSEPPAAGIVLTATGTKERGRQKVDLVWSGAAGSVNVLRDDVVVGTAAGATFRDEIDGRGKGTYVYQVCEVGSGGRCSNAVTVQF